MNLDEAIKRLEEDGQRCRHRAMEEPRDWPPSELIVRRWMCHGLDCAIVQGPFALCGYVKVPSNHPDAVKWYDDVDINVHGGLTFTCLDKDGGRWFGFDTGHAGDMVVIGATGTVLEGRVWSEVDMVDETTRLAEQLSGRDSTCTSL